MILTQSRVFTQDCICIMIEKKTQYTAHGRNYDRSKYSYVSESAISANNLLPAPCLRSAPHFYSSFLLLARRALFFPRFRLHVLRLVVFFVNFLISVAFTYFAYLWVRFILNLQNWPTDNTWHTRGTMPQHVEPKTKKGRKMTMVLSVFCENVEDAPGGRLHGCVLP